MSQYRHHVFVRTSGKTCPTQGSKDACDEVRYPAPPGDNKIVAE